MISKLILPSLTLGLVVFGIATVVSAGDPKFEVMEDSVCNYGFWNTRNTGAATCGPAMCSDKKPAECPDDPGCSSWVQATCGDYDPLDCVLQNTGGLIPALMCQNQECEIRPGVAGFKCKWVFDPGSNCGPITGLKECYVN